MTCRVPAARVAPAILTLLVPVLLAGPAGADLAIEEQGRVEERIAGVSQTVDELRSTLFGGELIDVVRAGAMAGGNEAAITDLAPESHVPTSLEEAAASISGAIRRANAIVRNSPAASLPAWMGRVAREVAVEGVQDPDVFRGVDPVSPAPALRAASIVARAVDAAMPALRAAGETMPARAEAVECDVLDQEGVCVGGTGSNSYSQHKVVTIDLGGNDTYLTDAGFVLTGAELVLDLTGDDTYTPREGFGHGYGNFGGVGMLVDGAGNDVYRSRSTTGDATGMGLGLLGGVGVMVDGGGNDMYEMSSEVSGSLAGVGGMGEAILGGVGVMVDGGGNDSYIATGIVHPTRGMTQPEDPEETPREVTKIGRAAVNVGGIGVFGAAAILADLGGTDTFSSESRIAAAPAEWPPVEINVDPLTGNAIQFAGVGGHGDGGLAGAGYMLVGPGPSVYRQRSVIESLPLDDPRMYMSHFGYGAASAGSVGVLSDVGGNDRYELELSATSAVSRSVDDACGTSCPVPAPFASGPGFLATGQGYAITGGVGLLDDSGGDDIYRTAVSDSVSVFAEDLRSQTGQAILRGGGSSQGAVFTGQGAGSAAAGVIRDALGNDRYELSTTSSVETSASSTLPQNEPDLVAQTGVARSLGQALAQGLGGVGAILDLGGSDAYSASAVSSSSANGAEQVLAGGQVLAQAAAAAGATGLGVALDLDGTAPDTYVTNPSLAACQGIRGQGVWRDCGTHGIGINA